MTFIFDEEEEIFAAINAARRTPEKAALRMPTPRGSRSKPYYGMYVSDPRPTRKEGLESLQAMYDVTSEFPKGGARGTLIHEGAYLLAAVLIAIDPQDRFRD